MKRFYLLSTLMLIMAVAMLPRNTKAQAPVWDGTWETWTQGSGTQADPYLIETPQHLAWLARQVNKNDSTYNGVCFRLTNDLDMNSLNWESIGNSTTNCFKGNFDGNNHFIDNVIVRYYTDANGNAINGTYAGLFGVIYNATIINLGVKSTITSNGGTQPGHVGGIVAMVKGSNNNISNCYHTGNISFSGTSSVAGHRGGIIGSINGETIIVNCHNYGLIYDHNSFPMNQNGYFGSVCRIGGIVGAIHATVTLSNCSNSGSINGRYGRYINDSGQSHSGGLIGMINSGTSVIIISCYNNGEIKGMWCGGLIGGSSAMSMTISNCYNIGTLSGGYYQGGLVGSSSSNCTITNSYNSGALSDGSTQGGLIGTSYGSAFISNCHNSGTFIANNESNFYRNDDRCCGGIIGYSSGTANFICCANSGSVIVPNLKPSYSSSNSSNAYAYCGGIIGYANTTVTLDRCYNTAVITGLGTNANGYSVFGHVGGLVGHLTASANNIHECYNTGNVTSKSQCGGILGYSEGVTSITNCYNTGSLSGTNNNVSSIAYGTATITNCYYLNTCGGSTNTGSESLTSAQMKSSSFLWMLNVGVQAYTMDGNPNVNQGYPIFGDMVYAVATQNATNVGVTRATLHGNYVGGADTVGFQYRENTTGSTWNTVYATVGSPVSYLLTGLQSNTGYVFRFIVLNNGGVYYGEEKTFTTGTCNLTASVSPSSVTICQGETTTVTASGQSSLGNQFSYNWNTGETTATISVFGGGERIVTVSDSNGCTATASVNVTVIPLPAVAISGNTTLCVGESSLLTASGGSSYVWNTGASTPSITVSNGGTYSVTASNSYGCSSSASVQVISLENVSISGNLNICQGQSTTLYANGTGSYLWNTGATTSFVTVTQAGLYTVTVSLGNCSSSASVLVSIAANPVPTISGNTTICQGETSLLTANGGNSYLWSNGSTNNSIGVSQSGTYSVTATSIEGCTGSTSTYVTVNPLPNVSISGNNSFCQGGSVSLMASGASSYSWSNGSNNATITVSNPGTYTVIGTNAAGCSATASKTVTVNPSYNIPLSQSICQGETYNFNGQYLTTAGSYTQSLSTVNGCDSIITLTLTVKALPSPTISGNTVICEGQTTTLTATGGISYAWSNGGTNGSVTVSQSGIYTVTATNAEGCSATANVTVTVNPLPTVVVGGNSTICEGGSTTLTASGADSYSWSTGDNTASVSINAFGVYTVTGTSTEGCSNTANVTVLVSQAPQITISGETDLCAGESTTLTANGGETYLWSNGSTDNTLIVSTTGTWQVIGYNAAGCSSMASATVSVWQPAASEFTVSCPDSCYTWNGTEYCASGDYAQTLQTVHGCDSVVTLHLTITVGIDDHDLAGSVKVFPNPANAMLNVQCSMGDEAATIELLDVTGKLLRTISATGETTSINVSDLADGMYFVRVTTDEGVVTKPYVVKR